MWYKKSCFSNEFFSVFSTICIFLALQIVPRTVDYAHRWQIYFGQNFVRTGVSTDWKRRFRCLAHFIQLSGLLQCAAVCCSVSQCVTVCHSVSVCCSRLLCVAVDCKVMQCVAMCCSVMQCVSVCCSGVVHSEANRRGARPSKPGVNKWIATYLSCLCQTSHYPRPHYTWGLVGDR